MKEKQLLWVRLACWILVLVLMLAGIGLWVLPRGEGRFLPLWKERNSSQEGDYAKNSQQFSDITAVEVTLKQYDVHVIPDENLSAGTVQLDITTDDEREMPLIEIKNGKLEIYQEDEGWNIQFFRFGINRKGFGIVSDAYSLTLRVPSKEVPTLSVTTVSGDILLEAVSAGKTELNTISGDVDVTCAGDTMNCIVVSGDVKLKKPWQELTLESVSGDLKMMANEQTRRIQTNSVSGTVKVQCDGVKGYTASMEAISGEFHDKYGSNKGKGNFSWGDGSLQLEANSVSGDVKLEDWMD